MGTVIPLLQAGWGAGLRPPTEHMAKARSKLQASQFAMGSELLDYTSSRNLAVIQSRQCQKLVALLAGEGVRQIECGQPVSDGSHALIPRCHLTDCHLANFSPLALTTNDNRQLFDTIKHSEI